MTHDTDITTITVVGTGAIGSAVAQRLLEAGHPVVLWNRRSGRARELTDLGATEQPSLQAAVAASSLTLMTLKDHSAVEDVLGQLDGDLAGRTIAVLTTGSPQDAVLTADRVERLGAAYLDAGVQISPEDIGSDRGILLYSGSRSAFDRHEAILRLLGSALFVGQAPQAASVWDLTLFGLWYDAQIGLLRALATVADAGIDAEVFAETAATQLGHVVDGAAATAEELRQGEFPRGPADLGEHLPVVRQLIELRTGGRLGDGGLPHVADLIESTLSRGGRALGLTAIAASSR